MKPVLAGCAVLLSGMLAGAAAPVALQATSATGLGVIHFGEKEDGIGYFDFALEGGVHPSGSLVFAAEHHEGYPDFVIILDDVDRLRFSGKSFRLQGSGRLHDDPVTVRASAVDNNGTQSPDTFHITALRGSDVLFEAEGELVSGDIQIGEDE